MNALSKANLAIKRKDWAKKTVKKWLREGKLRKV